LTEEVGQNVAAEAEQIRGGTNQYFSIIGMLGTVPDSYLFQIPVIKYLLPPHTVLVIGPALDSVQNSRSVSNRFGG
jgi:hypothetical protein